ncbi:classical arabinogalactan protein 9-like [Miscanthus floridulus]|uniref:classical arabinogalactan protein 9-like n=1 Tax=Miscanthus floridulus TaxID=154761 RepID=UPI0034599B0F
MARVLSPLAARILLPHLRRAVVAAPPPPVVAPSPLLVSCGRIRSIGRGGAPFPTDPTSTSAQMAPTRSGVLSPPAMRILLPHLRCAVVAAPPPPVVAPSPLPVSCGRTRSIGRGGAPFPLDPTSTSAQMAPTAAAATRAHAHHVPAPVTSQVSGPSPRH